MIATSDILRSTHQSQYFHTNYGPTPHSLEKKPKFCAFESYAERSHSELARGYLDRCRKYILIVVKIVLVLCPQRPPLFSRPFFLFEGRQVD